MPQGYTLEQLQNMGARPAGTAIAPQQPEQGPSKSYTLDDLQKLNARPVSPEDTNIPGQAAPPQNPTWGDWAKSLLPSWRGAARTVGGAVGALAGPEMIPLGVVGGELAYQALSPEKRTVSDVGSQLSGAAAEGVLGAVVPPLARYHAEEGFPSVREFAAKNITAPKLNSILGVRPEEIAAGRRNPGARIIGEKIISTSRQDLMDQMKSKMKDWGGQLEQKLSSAYAADPSRTVNVMKEMEDAFYETRKRIGVGSDPAFKRRLSIIFNDVNNYTKNELGQPDLTRVPPLEAQKLKSFIGQSVKWGTNIPHEAGTNETLSKMYSNINNAIEQQVPGTKALLGQYGDFEVGTNALQREIDRMAVGQKVKGSVLRSTLAGRATHPSGPMAPQPFTSRNVTTPRATTAEDYLRSLAP